jgi:hypothetical protein
VAQLKGRWYLETCNVDALRIDAGENVLDGAILARRIHALKNQQHRHFLLFALTRDMRTRLCRYA